MKIEREGKQIVLSYDKPKMEEYELAELLGLKTDSGCYKDTNGTTTVFTSPPAFMINKSWIPYLLAEASKRNIDIENKNDSEKLVVEFINKLQ